MDFWISAGGSVLGRGVAFISWKAPICREKRSALVLGTGGRAGDDAGVSTRSPEEAYRALQRLARADGRSTQQAIELTDGVVFDVECISLVTIRENAKYEGIRVVVPASLGGAVLKLRLDPTHSRERVPTERPAGCHRASGPRGSPAGTAARDATGKP
jgi:hypothetical protein